MLRWKAHTEFVPSELRYIVSWWRYRLPDTLRISTTGAKQIGILNTSRVEAAQVQVYPL